MKIEAIFVIEGREDGASSVRETHRRYLEAYGLSAAEHPLLMLRPSNWREPFVALTG